MYRASGGGLDFSSQGHTPSKRSKYDSFTPRKRYVKEQEETVRVVDRDYQFQSPFREDENQIKGSKIRNLSSSRRKECKNKDWEQSPMTFGEKQLKDVLVYDLPQENLQNSIPVYNPRLSLRKQRLKKNCEEVEFGRKINFQDQNRDRSNFLREKPIKMILQPQPLSLTPRKYKQNKENVDSCLTQKMIALQSKIARLERMTPQRPSTPRGSRISEHSYDSEVILFQRQQPQKVVNEVSEKESELLSRVSLGRLVEEEEGESELQMIQDLSYKISSRLKSIIRNFS